MSSILIIPPTYKYPGSRGDEALMLVTKNVLEQSGHSAVFAVHNPANPDWQFILREMGTLAGMKSLDFNDYDGVICLGADCYDGSYSIKDNILFSEVAYGFVQQKKPASIIGMSFRPNVAPEVIQNIARLRKQVYFTVRDPISFARFVAACPGASPALSADPAFLLTPSQPPPEILAWIEAQRCSGRLYMGFNINRHAAEDLDDTVGKSLDWMETMSKASFVLIPHDSRLNAGDQMACNMLWESASLNLRQRMFNCPMLGCRQVKGICQQLDGVITGRMHLAIACLSQGIPALGFDYNYKMPGLYGFFGLHDYVVKGEDVGTRAQGFVDRLPWIRQQIATGLSRVKALAAGNYDCLNRMFCY